MARSTEIIETQTHADPLVRGSSDHYLDAIYYDHTYRLRRDDIAFYRRFARQYGGPVLELGGGSGRVAIPLAADGLDVTVLDPSEPMLERARDRAAETLDEAARARLALVQGDAREFSFDKKFPLIFAPFNVLLHLYEPDDFARCFHCVAEHLAPGGRFVFDVRVPNLRELSRDPQRVYRSHGFRHPTLGYRVEYTESFRYDPIKQVQHVRIRFEPATGAPAGAKPQETLLTQRQIFPNEMRALLALGGLRLAGRYGDFSGRPLSPDDPQEIVIAQKAGK